MSSATLTFIDLEGFHLTLRVFPTPPHHTTPHYTPPQARMHRLSGTLPLSDVCGIPHDDDDDTQNNDTENNEDTNEEQAYTSSNGGAAWEQDSDGVHIRGNARAGGDIQGDIAQQPHTRGEDARSPLVNAAMNPLLGQETIPLPMDEITSSAGGAMGGDALAVADTPAGTHMAAGTHMGGDHGDPIPHGTGPSLDTNTGDGVHLDGSNVDGQPAGGINIRRVKRSRGLR